MLANVFKELGLSPTSEKVYARLLKHGTASAKQLSEHLGVPRPSIYDHLHSLKENDLITEQHNGTNKTFQACEPAHLSRLLTQKVERLAAEVIELEKQLPTLAKDQTQSEPRIKFYSGTAGVKKVLEDMLWHKNTQTYTVWSSGEMMDILGSEYLRELNRKRIHRNISVQGIWQAGDCVNFKQYPFMGVGKKFLRTLRTAPEELTWQMSYWIYADKVAFISSQRETFGFVVQSVDFRDLMKTQFDAMWPQCKNIKPESHHTDMFLKSIGALD